MRSRLLRRMYYFQSELDTGKRDGDVREIQPADVDVVARAELDRLFIEGLHIIIAANTMWFLSRR